MIPTLVAAAKYLIAQQTPLRVPGTRSMLYPSSGDVVPMNPGYQPKVSTYGAEGGPR